MIEEISTTNKKTILVIEDDLFLQRILVQKLEQNGFAVEKVIDGEEAYAILEKKRIDLILLDLLLPGIEGREVLQKIKGTSQWQGIPVIIASNLDNLEERKLVKDLGAADYLVKAQHTPNEIIQRVVDELH